MWKIRWRYYFVMDSFPLRILNWYVQRKDNKIMEEAERLFKFIAEKFEAEIDNVNQGPMMSSPGIKYKDKVFAFYYKEKMVFKLGQDFDPRSQGIKNFSYLNPFKKKPPMKAWFEIPFTESNKWEELAYIALNNIK
jgi:hypothetical protein